MQNPEHVCHARNAFIRGALGNKALCRPRPWPPFSTSSKAQDSQHGESANRKGPVVVLRLGAEPTIDSPVPTFLKKTNLTTLDCWPRCRNERLILSIVGPSVSLLSIARRRQYGEHGANYTEQISSEIMDKFLFLTGVGRSGTTVLRTGLGQHPDIYYNGKENNIVQDLLKVAYHNCTLTSRKFAMVVSQKEYDHIFRDALKALLWPDAVLKTRPCKMAAINFEGNQLDYLGAVFPGCKVLCLVRNGIEVISSRMRHPSFASQSFETHCEVWNRSLGVIRWGASQPDRFRLVRHEWFYQTDLFQPELKALYQWAGISYSELPFNHIAGTLRHPTPSGQTIASDAFIHSSDTEKTHYFLSKRQRWSDWNPQQRQQFETICGEQMQTLDYVIPWNT